MPRKEYLLKKRRTETEESATKCQKLTNFFSKGAAENRNQKQATDRTDDQYDQVSQSSSSRIDDNNDRASDGAKATTSYQGYILNIDKIQGKVGDDILSAYHKKIGSRKRLLAKCLICNEFEEDAKKCSSNGTVYIAHGVRCDSEEKLTRIVDHFRSREHAAAVDAKKFKELWENQTLSHPWLRILQKQGQFTVQNLIKLAMDVYNDSKQLTLSAWSWPSRSLAAAHAEQQILSLKENGIDAPFLPFEPKSKELHYRDPLIYKEMLTIIAELENEKLKAELQDAIKFSSQIDGSVDSMQHDNKFMFIRINSPTEPIEVKTRFVTVASSELKGAAGLEDCFLTSMKSVGVDEAMIREKFAGVTTDGESANTGRNTGLWKRLADCAGHELMNFWCACHRSDLAMEDMEASVPELKMWKSNLLSIPEYYHESAVRTKSLKTLLPTMKAYPTYHNVRFAQHINNVCIAVVHNLKGSLQHWTNLSEDQTMDRRERQKAQGNLNVWKEDGVNAYLTSLMSDVCSVFQTLQKQLQKVSIIIPDIMKFKDVAIQKLTAMTDAPYFGGTKEKWVKENGSLDDIESAPDNVRQAKKTHRLIDGLHRGDHSVQ